MVSYQYTANDRAALVYPNGRTVDQTYHYPGGPLRTILDDGAPTPIAQYDYLGGRTLVRAMQNGVNLDLRDGQGGAYFDASGRPTKWLHLRYPVNPVHPVLIGFEYAYDANGNKLYQKSVHDPLDSQRYAYDSADRLTACVRGPFGTLPEGFCGPSTGTWSGMDQYEGWNLDGLGNWSEYTTRKAGPTSATATTVETRTDDTFNAYATVGSSARAHDANGNETVRGTFSFEWDAFDRLRTIRSSGEPVVAFAYDADGRRLWREANLTSVTLHARVAVFSGWRIVQETDADGTSLTQLVSGVALDEHLAQDFDLDGDGVANGLADKRVYFHQNPLLSVYGETDRLGRVVRGREYDPYGAQHLLLNGADADGVVNFDSSDIRTLGEPVTAAWSPSFTGKPAVGVADLYWLGKRYLDAGDGRFLSRDTIQGPTGPVWGSVSALLKNDRLPPWDPLRETPYADGPNLEAYVGDSPMNFTDPLGLFTHGVGKACKHYLPPHGEVQRAINALTAPSPSQYTCMSDKAQNAKVTCSHDGCGPCSSTNGTKGDTDARNNITVCMDECNRQVPKCGPQDLVKILVHEMAHACGMPGELGNKAGTAQPWPDGQTAPPPWNGHGIPGTEPDPNDPGNSTPGHIKCMGK